MKKIKHQRSALLALCFLLAACVQGQTSYERFYLKKDFFLCRLEELRNEYSQQKIIPSELEVECLAALSYYPELKNTLIEFRFGNIKTTMESRPKLNFVVTSKEKRKYVIIISYSENKTTNLDWKNLSFNALVGWIGHELGHILYYTKKGNPAIVCTGLKYALPGFKRKFEQYADKITIEHDLGFALYEGTEFTINHSAATKKYKDKQIKFYLSPAEISSSSLSQQKL